jgi:hypothetical protein
VTSPSYTKNLVKNKKNLTSEGRRFRSPFFLCLMHNLKAVTTGVVASIEFFWSIMANPAISRFWPGSAPANTADPRRPPASTKAGPSLAPGRRVPRPRAGSRIAALNPEARDQDLAWHPWGGRSHGGFLRRIRDLRPDPGPKFVGSLAWSPLNGQKPPKWDQKEG